VIGGRCSCGCAGGWGGRGIRVPALARVLPIEGGEVMCGSDHAAAAFLRSVGVCSFGGGRRGASGRCGGTGRVCDWGGGVVRGAGGGSERGGGLRGDSARCGEGGREVFAAVDAVYDDGGGERGECNVRDCLGDPWGCAGEVAGAGGGWEICGGVVGRDGDDAGGGVEGPVLARGLSGAVVSADGCGVWGWWEGGGREIEEVRRGRCARGVWEDRTM